MLIALVLESAAYACGGFFCNQTPVDQSAERIVFAVDETTSTVETHVQIFYTGVAAEFAWVVPVAQIPEIFVSTDTLFDNLALYTAPTFQTDIVYEGECQGYYPYWLDYAGSYSSSASADTGSAGESVEVIATQQVGPYETVTLKAETETGLIAWLQDNGYDLPDDLTPLLAPYVAGDAYFVALRLANGFDSGDIAPLGLRYTGARASIPIQLTSIAATPDMRLEVYVLGRNRAVPDNYLHVVINEALIDWTTGGSNYDAVVTAAADQAGGQAFATDMSGPAADWRWVVPEPGDVSGLAAVVNPINWLDGAIEVGVPANDAMLAVLRTYIPMPDDLVADGLSETNFYNCLSCYSDSLGGQAFDPVAATAALEELVTDPLHHALGLFDTHAQLTRLNSSVSPVEMTVDPIFVFNSVMPDEDGLWLATLVYECPTGEDYEDALRRVELPDGRILVLPSIQWLADSGVTVAEWLAASGMLPAARIEDTSEDAEAIVLYDVLASGTDTTLETLNTGTREDVLEPGIEATASCACTTDPSSTGALWVGLAAFVASNRRTRRAG